MRNTVASILSLKYFVCVLRKDAADLAMDLVVSDPAVEAIEESFKSTKLFCVL